MRRWGGAGLSGEGFHAAGAARARRARLFPVGFCGRTCERPSVPRRGRWVQPLSAVEPSTCELALPTILLTARRAGAAGPQASAGGRRFAGRGWGAAAPQTPHRHRSALTGGANQRYCDRRARPPGRAGARRRTRPGQEGGGAGSLSGPSRTGPSRSAAREPGLWHRAVSIPHPGTGPVAPGRVLPGPLSPPRTDGSFPHPPPAPRDGFSRPLRGPRFAVAEGWPRPLASAPADWSRRRAAASQSAAPLAALSLGGRKQKQASTGARGPRGRRRGRAAAAGAGARRPVTVPRAACEGTTRPGPARRGRPCLFPAGAAGRGEARRPCGVRGGWPGRRAVADGWLVPWGAASPDWPGPGQPARSRRPAASGRWAVAARLGWAASPRVAPPAVAALLRAHSVRCGRASAAAGRVNGCRACAAVWTWGGGALCGPCASRAPAGRQSRLFVRARVAPLWFLPAMRVLSG